MISRAAKKTYKNHCGGLINGFVPRTEWTEQDGMDEKNTRVTCDSLWSTLLGVSTPYQEQTCPESFYQTSDGACRSITECDETQYETKAPTATSNRVCTDLTTW
jgi:hypothetical protein